MSELIDQILEECTEIKTFKIGSDKQYLTQYIKADDLIKLFATMSNKVKNAKEKEVFNDLTNTIVILKRN